MNDNINIELYLLKWFYKHAAYSTFGGYVETKFLKDNNPEIFRIFTALGHFHTKYPETDVPSTEALRVLYYTLFPKVSEKDGEVTELLLSKIDKLSVEQPIAEDFITEHRRRSKATEISLLALHVAEGRKPFQELLNSIEGLNQISLPMEEVNEFVVVSDEGSFPEQGLRWRLASLNRSLGSLRRGNNGFLFARPEAGKTTLAISESTFMAEQASAPTIYFNNEQPGELMYLRAVQASLGINQETLFKYKKQALKKFRDKTKGQFQIYDSAYMQRKDIERVCQRHNPALLVFDQLDKIKGFDDDRNDLQLKHIYQWARELSKEYGPVIGLCQAGGTAEGKKWLTMDDVDSSKTAKQGEADWILGIGKSNQEGMESIRHFNISKNKLLGDSDTDPSLRHGKMEVRINPEICRFEDL